MQRQRDRAEKDVQQVRVTPSHVKELLTILDQLIKDVRTSYFADLINDKHNPRLLFDAISRLVSLLFTSCSLTLNQFPRQIFSIQSHTWTLSSCPAVIIPPKFIKGVMPHLPQILSIMNQSFLSGCLPDYSQHLCSAVKPYLDPTVSDTHRTISKLTFISEILEKVCQVVYRLNSSPVRDKPTALNQLY